MRLLLDTHAVIWALSGDPRLSEAGRAAIADADNEILVSSVSVMEIATKHRLGKLPGVADLVRDFSGVFALADYTVLAMTLEHAAHAGSMGIPHKDPFDRLLMAQAQIEQVPLVSNERLFDGFGLERIW